MKNKSLLFLSFIIFAVLVSMNTNAQRGGRGGRSTPPPTTPGGGGTNTNPPPAPGGGVNKGDTTKPKPKQGGSKRIYTVEELQGDGGNDYGSEVKKTLPSKSSYGYAKNNVSERKPLDYDHIREDDATFSHYVWREIDAREKMNLPFLYKVKDDNGDQRFYSILLKAIKKDSVMAFEDERFTTPLTEADIAGLTSRYNAKILDTLTTPNIDNPDILDTIIKPRESANVPKSDSVYKFRIKEQWIFDRESSRLTVRIIGIAPLFKKDRDPAPSTPFWIYYPDLRPTLSRNFAYNPKNVGSQLSWEEVFEGRFFSSYIIKSTLNNPGDKTLAQLIKDPLFQLLEGENIKEKLFNYEQDLWSY